MVDVRMIQVTSVNFPHYAWPIAGTCKCLLLLSPADPVSITLFADPTIREPLSSPWVNCGVSQSVSLQHFAHRTPLYC